MLDSLGDFAVETTEDLGDGSDEQLERLLDEEEADSFPASDPYSEWAGPGH